jgi:hypothetical protein
MQAYVKSLTTPGTTLVLKPDSEFFKYLGKATEAPRQPEAAPQTPSQPQAQSEPAEQGQTVQ